MIGLKSLGLQIVLGTFFFMNLFISNLILNNYINSPIFTSNYYQNIQFNKNIYFKSFSNLFFNTKSNLNLFKNYFKTLLNCPIFLSLNNFENLVFNSFQNFSLTINNFFIQCIFQDITSNSNTCGVYIGVNTMNCYFDKCNFINLYCIGPFPHSAAIYVEPANDIKIYCNFFDRCKSSHGASFGIHSNVYSINFFDINYSLEINLGYNQYSQPCPSFFGGHYRINVLNNNFSNSILTGAGAIHPLHSLNNGYLLKYSQITSVTAPRLIYTWTSDKKQKYANSNFINLTTNNNQIRVESGSIPPTFENCNFQYFFNIQFYSGPVNCIINNCKFQVSSSFFSYCTVDSNSIFDSNQIITFKLNLFNNICVLKYSQSINFVKKIYNFNFLLFLIKFF